MRFGVSVLVPVIIMFCSAALAGGESLSTDVRDQTGVEITIYNSDIGLVKDRRAVSIPEGRLELKFMGIASGIIPPSVYIKCIRDSEGFRVLEQNYEYDLLNPQKLMEKYVGRDVKIYYKNPYTDKEEITAATILSTNDGVVLRVKDGITFGYEGSVLFPSVPEDLISKPSLVWLIENKAPHTRQEIEATYLTEGMNWSADYVFTLNDTDDRADLNGWVTIDNRSGAAYRDARLKLVAGNIHRVEKEFKPGLVAMRGNMEKEAEPAFKEEALFEYHMYTLDRKTTIRENKSKQISLMSAGNISVKKEFIFYGASYYYRGQYGEIVSNQKLGVFVEVENRKENNLGMPLPKGTVRLYKKDAEGSLQFIGEDSIVHTPKDEAIIIQVGEAFDVVGSRRQTDWRKKFWETYEAAFEITLKNHKGEDVTVKVVEPIPGQWKIIESSHDFEKKDASTAVFKIHVPKDGESVLTYRVSMKF